MWGRIRGWNLLTVEQQREAIDQWIGAKLVKAYMRMQLKNAAFIPGLLKNYSKEYLAEYMTEIYLPSDDPVEEQFQQIVDRLIPFIFPDKKIDQIIFMTLPLIKDAHEAILKHGGGWSSTKSNLEKRKTAVLDWYRRNQSQRRYYLSTLKEKHLQNSDLYNDGGGQEKRNFIKRLLINIIKTETNKQLTFRELDERIRKLNKVIGQPLRLEDL